MKTKTIYWILGGVAVAVGGYFAYKHFTKDDTSSAEGKSKPEGESGEMSIPEKRWTNVTPRSIKKKNVNCGLKYSNIRCDGHWQYDTVSQQCRCQGTSYPIG